VDLDEKPDAQAERERIERQRAERRKKVADRLRAEADRIEGVERDEEGSDR